MRKRLVHAVAVCVLSLSALIACAPEGEIAAPNRPGVLDPAGGQDDAQVAVITCMPSLTSLQEDVFAARCATAGCHRGAAAAAALDLTRADLASLLVSQSASSCEGQTLVVPGNPAASLLMAKVSGHVPAGCGDPMPPVGSLLSAPQIECVRGWIAGLGTSDAGVVNPDAGTGCASCGGLSCLDLSSDEQNCGSCSHACPAGATCAGGACACPAGLSLCNGVCVDLSSDRTHCGGCATSCSSAAVCSGGACVCGQGLASCNGGCVETASDPNNCQACNVKCSAGQLCTPTGCSSTATCGKLTQCGSACVDTTTSLTHCGGCNIACAAGQACQAGQCVCPGGGALCAGSCVDTQTSALNCGACGKVCSGGTSCAGGTCTCDDGGSLCGGSCVDTKSDANNCGSCGNVCGPGKACTQGVCACASGPVSFASVSKILVDGCTNSGCHAGAAPKAGLNLTATKAYSELVDVKASQCSDGRVLVPARTTGKSYLLQKLYGEDLCSGTQMPKAGSSLPASSLALIEAWICNGAPP